MGMPHLVGERWREMWLERLDALPLFLEPWLMHQRRDAYWKHGSVCEDWAAIDAAFLDPPYNVRISGHANAVGRHREFAMASGEMSDAEFGDFLTSVLQIVSDVSVDGAIAFVCMDWRHMGEMLAAGKSAFTELKNLVVWNKTNGGMGSFYRSKHELIFVFKHGTLPHTNSFGLGETGRYRTNYALYFEIAGFISFMFFMGFMVHFRVSNSAYTAIC